MENKGKNFIITENVAQGILDYLSTKPFKEVNGLVQALQNIVPLPDLGPEDKPEIVKEIKKLKKDK